MGVLAVLSLLIVSHMGNKLHSLTSDGAIRARVQRVVIQRRTFPTNPRS